MELIDVTPATSTVFDLRGQLEAKADPTLIAADEQHFELIDASLRASIAADTDRLAVVRRAPGGAGQAAMDRDSEIRRLSARLGSLRRFGLDLCLGRIVDAADGETLYVGRMGLTDESGRPLLIDWRTPAAEPFFAATRAHPMGLRSRRRYRWSGGRISDYWDEAFSTDGLDGHAALDDESAFIASLGASRSPRMRDVLSTIAADQDAVIRAGSRGALVVEGGPGTGKTVVALHRVAYLLYADPRLSQHRGGVLVVGPHEPYLAYVSDVLPSLGEDGVQLATLADLLPEGATAAPEPNPQVTRIKSTSGMVSAVEAGVRFYEEPPTKGMVIETEWYDLWLGPEDWAEAFGSPDPGTPHNDAREQVRDELLTILVGTHHGEVGVAPEVLRRSLTQNPELSAALARAWPLLDAATLVGDLWSVPAYLRRCAPWLTADEVRALRRPSTSTWTVADLPLLDAARQRLGDPHAAQRRHRQQAAAAAEQARMDDVVEDLIATDDSEMGVMSMLRGQDLQAALATATGPDPDPDRLAGPFAHIVVDEAQELTDAQWQMLLRRCPSGSLTIVGDRAQARHGFTDTWSQRLSRVGIDVVEVATLGINYRTPAEIMAEAEPVIRTALPDATVPTSIRHSGVPVTYRPAGELLSILESWTAQHAEGTACVIGDPTIAPSARIASLIPELAKGLEFDLVVLAGPTPTGSTPGIEDAVDRYVAMTRATKQLIVLTP